MHVLAMAWLPRWNQMTGWRSATLTLCLQVVP